MIYQGGVGGPLVFGAPLGDERSLYGTAGNVAYKLRAPPAAGGDWTYTTLYTFPLDRPPVQWPLAVGASGSLFGVTESGGYVGGFCLYFEGCGTVFSLTPPATAGGPWAEQILHLFNPGAGDGNRPNGGLVIGPGGVLYGATPAGGEGYEKGGGTVFSLTPPAVPGAPMTESILSVRRDRGRLL